VPTQVDIQFVDNICHCLLCSQSTVGVIVRVEKDGFQVYQLCLDAEFVVWTVFMCCDFCLICSYTIVVTRPCMVGR